MTPRAVGERFIAALQTQAWNDVADCLRENVALNALIPRGLRTADDRASAANCFRKWCGDADELVLVTSTVEPIEDRLHVAYRFRAHDDRWDIVEQHLYCTVRDEEIDRIDLLCSGFRPQA